MMTLLGVGRVVERPVIQNRDGVRFCVLSLNFSEYRTTQQKRRRKFVHTIKLEAWSTAADTLANNANPGDYIEIRATPRGGDNGFSYRLDTFEFLRYGSKKDRDQEYEEDVEE